MRPPKRWMLMDRVLVVTLALLVLFAWADSESLKGIHKIDSQWSEDAGGFDEERNVWIIFWDYISPAWFILWIGVLAAVGFVWYLFTKDKSEALAIFITPTILVLFGVQDLIYYALSPDVLSDAIGCWASVIPGLNLISTLLGEECPTPTSFYIANAVGIFLAYKAYTYFKSVRTW